MEHYVYGNVCNGVLKRDSWCDVTSALNLRCGTSYTELVVMTRFKNMKADFKILYQLCNKSGWGWDEELHRPIAPDEIWDELLKVSPKYGRFRRNSFHQFHIFEKICAVNITTGIEARATMHTTSQFGEQYETVGLDEDDVQTDDFLASHGLSFVETQGKDTSTINIAVEPSLATFSLRTPSSSGKRSLEEKSTASRSTKRHNQNETSGTIRQKLHENAPIPIHACLEKLNALEDISDKAIIAVHEAIRDSYDNKAAFMSWEGTRLRRWIEHIVAHHPDFHSRSPWL